MHSDDDYDEHDGFEQQTSYDDLDGESDILSAGTQNGKTGNNPNNDTVS